KKIETSKAEAMPGVLSVATHADFPKADGSLEAGESTLNVRDLSRNILADDKVLYNGHAVAAVAAYSERLAEEALDLIEVEYEVLPHVLDIEAAMRDDAPILHEDLFTKGLEEKPDKPSNVATRAQMQLGDVKAGFAEADVIVEREFRLPRAHQGYIEPHACTVRYDEDGQSLIWCSSQGHFDVRMSTAALLGMELGKIKVVPSEIGGGFGGKTTVYLEPVALILSRKAGKPVKMVMGRDEVFTSTGPTSAAVVRAKVGAKRDGTITAAEGWMAYDAGAFPGSPLMPGVMTMFTPYDLENVNVVGFDVVVNRSKAGAYRAPGAP
ncbi:uncharacterized protein METZ01_LOCUS346925, partial [marine metagenome]